ncbi:MAG: hypothetical protein ABIS26_00265, partial [Candidatus Paceibacterota bacterium]
DFFLSKQSYFLSESGLEDIIYKLKTAYPVAASNTITLNGNSATTTVATGGYNIKTITSLGDVTLRQRKNTITLSPGDGISFNYGIQSGIGGFIMNNNSGVNGNVYSNGNISGSGGVYINGTAVSAGASGIIDEVSVGSNGKGDAWAHTVTDSSVVGNLYCQTGSGNNKSCNSVQGDPPLTPMPITQEMIDQWKSDAELGGTVAGNLTISSPTSLGPKKITGDLAINSNLTITGTLYVVGKITTGNGVQVSLDPSYGATGGIIIVDGTVNLSNNAQFSGSGAPNTYILLMTTSACPTVGCTTTNAVEIANNVGAVIVNAQNGTAHLNNNITLNEIVANKIIMDNNVVINYLSGLASTVFTSGPSGGWSIQSWKEIK